MEKYKILVTGVGAVIGYGLANSLRGSRYSPHIVGMDIYGDAYGQRVCDEFVQAVPAADPGYPAFLRELVREKGIDLVMFGTEQEIHRLADEREAMGEDYQKLVINDRALVGLARDKWETHCFLAKNGFDTIPTYIGGGFQELSQELGLPFLLKPRQSYASKGIVRVHSREEFDFYTRQGGGQLMAQKIVGDDAHEYTAAAFGLGDGTCTRPIILRRRLSQEGATAKASVEGGREAEEMVYRLVRAMKPVGPTNFQFRLDGGRWLLLEVNPRISSSTSLRAAFGYNEAEMCIDYYIRKLRPADAEIRKGSAVRYIADCVMLDDGPGL